MFVNLLTKKDKVDTLWNNAVNRRRDKIEGRVKKIKEFLKKKSEFASRKNSDTKSVVFASEKNVTKIPRKQKLLGLKEEMFLWQIA